MFTGIIESTGTVRETREVAGGRRLRVDVGVIARDCDLGASIAVSGVCLTVADHDDSTVTFDVISETLQKSTLGALRTGERVNIERALRAGDRMDGHFVQGHVDGTATVDRVESSSREQVVWLKPEPHLTPYLVPKGSVALDGISLTIADLRDSAFSVALIPTTLERTTFSSLSPRDRINVETDIITRTIVHHLFSMSGATGISMETLREQGFA